MRLFVKASAVLFCVLAVGCGSDPVAPVPGTDGGGNDAMMNGDALMNGDARVDGALPDGGGDAATLMDGALPDGMVILPDGMVILPDGMVVTDGGVSDGSVTTTCADLTCGEHAHCDEGSGSTPAICVCDDGYEGDGATCTEINECDPNPCMNDGACTDAIDDFSCECAAGFSGATCETNIDDCDPNPCLNGGSCEDGVNSFTCDCPSGFPGTHCEAEIILCDTDPCLNGATCTDGATGFSCECAAGFNGATCENNIDDCDPNPCEHSGTCVDGVNSFTCECATGYSGSTCMTNIDECLPNPCMNSGTCVDGLASYTCMCAPGFTGTNCETNLDDCSPNPCMNSGTCVDGAASYSCMCAPGFSGTNCETNINDCSPNPCMNGGSCADGVATYTCTCPTGYSGTNCETNINECSPNPCMNSGTCVDGIGSYTCMCPTGFSGTNCEININDCSPNPCMNSGTCVDGVASYTCMCPAGYTGTNCETNINDCMPNPCMNGGSCADGVASYTCTCAAGYSGTNCETNINECSPNPCMNGGSCTDGINSYTCMCAAGYSGTNCETNINECSPNPCLNGGSCTDGVNSYTCTCAMGWSGPTCSTATPLGTTCLNIHTLYPALPDGVYLIDPNGGSSSDAFSVRCDMTVDGGGWMKVLQYNTASYTPTTAAAGDITTATTPAFAKLSDAQINSVGAVRTYRLQGGTTAQRAFIEPAAAATYVDTMVAQGLMRAAPTRICQNATGYSACAWTTTGGNYIDTLAWGLVGNDGNRYFADYSGGSINCYNPSAAGVRCFNSGASTGHAIIPNFSMWVREAIPSTSGLVAYWNMNENTGTTFADASGTMHPGTATGTWTATGHLGSGFTGSALSAATFTSMTSATYSVWVRRSGVGMAVPRIISWPSDAFEIGDFSSGGTLGIYTPGLGWQNTGGALPIGTWVHVAVTVGGGTVKAYINGTQVGMNYSTTATMAGLMYMGVRASGGEPFVGSFDHLRVYNRVLTPFEISALAAE